MKLAGKIKKSFKEHVKNKRYRGNKAAADFNAAHGMPPLSAEDIEEIDRYWGQFHVRFEDYEWHRMFYGVTGVHDPRFLPQTLVLQILCPYFNNQELRVAYADKNMFSTILPDMKFPTEIGKRAGGRYYDTENRCYGREITDAFVDRVYAAFTAAGNGRIHDVILKEAIGSACGKGVRKVRVESKEDLKKALADFDAENIAVQMAVQQHPFFAQFNKDSVNIIRITTWRSDNEVFVFSPCIRFGIAGSHTDVAFRDGKEILNVLKIGKDGVAADKYVTLDGEYLPLPDGYDRVVPGWDRILNTVKENAKKLKFFDYVGWDVTVDEDGDPVCIEYNLYQPGAIIYQFAHGPFAGEHTDELLAFLKNKKNLSLLPGCIRKRK